MSVIALTHYASENYGFKNYYSDTVRIFLSVRTYIFSIRAVHMPGADYPAQVGAFMDDGSLGSGIFTHLSLSALPGRYAVGFVYRNGVIVCGLSDHVSLRQ